MYMPAINANDDQIDLVSWNVHEKDYVSKGQLLCTIETSKSILEIESISDGIFRKIAEPGKKYEVGIPICYIASDEFDHKPESIKLENLITTEAQPEKRWSKKAFFLSKNLGLDITDIALKNPDLFIDEKFINNLSFIKKNKDNLEYIDKNSCSVGISLYNKKEKILILGAGGGGSLVIDILSRISNQLPIGILDNDKAKIGQLINGVPILGDFSIIDNLWKDQKFDKLISTIVRSIDDRAQIYNLFYSKGIPFANIIDPSVRIGDGVSIGTGNLIIYGSYLASDVSIGNNNFLAAGTYIEHHCKVGSNCTFGPRTSLSGAVTVYDNVKFGMQVGVEPQLSIGRGSVIASGIVITSNIPEKSTVKTTINPIIKTDSSNQP